MAGVCSRGSRGTWYGWCPTCGKEGPDRRTKEEAGADCDSHEVRNPEHAKGYGIPGTEVLHSFLTRDAGTLERPEWGERCGLCGGKRLSDGSCTGCS